LEGPALATVTQESCFPVLSPVPGMFVVPLCWAPSAPHTDSDLVWAGRWGHLSFLTYVSLSYHQSMIVGVKCVPHSVPCKQEGH
jgi:hypothetical protein